MGSLDMILDLSVLIALAPFLVLIGLALVIYGKEILDIMAFPIGALAGGILAYMILEGLLESIHIPILISIIITIIMAIGGGLVGKGTTAMLLALFTSTVIVDVVAVFIGYDKEVLLVVIGLVLFLGMVALVPRFMEVFSSFLGGTAFAMGITPFLDGMDDLVLRVIQFSIIMVLCVIGGFVQFWVNKKVARMKEQITWVPTKGSSA
ncbi:MAG: hypothetical protein ACMUHU_01975 [Thermoplasmatota archaeon]